MARDRLCWSELFEIHCSATQFTRYPTGGQVVAGSNPVSPTKEHAVQLLRNSPGLSAYAVMAVDAVGRPHDDHVNAERHGVARFGHTFRQKG